MNNVSYRVEEDCLILELIGHIDSGNAIEVENDVKTIRAEHPTSSIVVDCAKLEYIASAGLRIILRNKRAVPDTRLINVSSTVYEILEMTGFTEMMEIHKAFRVISVEGCEVIGQGANGKVYKLDRDTILKAYLNPDALSDIRRERELARTAFVLGVPTAISYDVVKIKEGGFGSVFELLDAGSLLRALQKGTMTLEEVVDSSISLLKIIHATEVDPEMMPDMKAIALDWAEFLQDYLPENTYAKLHALVDGVPEDHHMLHGDFHLKNVIYQNGESILIDMDTICYGNPVFELASMFNAYCGFRELDPEESRTFIGVPDETSAQLWDKSLRAYLDTDDEDLIALTGKKAKIIGYTRLMRRRIRRHGLESEKGRAEIDCCRRHLEDLLPQIDTLAI